MLIKTAMTMAHWILVAAQSLAGLYLVAVWLHIASGFAQRWSRGLSLSGRWALLSLVFAYLLTLFFHLLTACGAFRLWIVLVLSMAAQVICHFAVMPFPCAWRSWADDAQTFFAALRNARASVIVAACVFSALACVTLAKTLLVPPLGWDAVSYHAAKAAMWVQSGRLSTLVGPGGWSYFPLFPGGGDLIYAWGMLPFRSDVLACAVGGMLWAAGGLAAYALARVLKVSRLAAGAAAVLVLYTPAVMRMVGSCYVEPVLQWYTTLMALCAALYFEKDEPVFMMLAGAAVGLMMGVKVMGLVLGGTALVVLALYVAVEHRRSGAHGLALAVCVVLAALAVWPWWLRSIQATGRPLSPLPIRLLGLELGRINPDLQWLQVRPSTVFSWAREWAALKALFLWNEASPSLGLAWAGLAATLMVLLPRLLKRPHHRSRGFLVALLGAFLGAYYHPDMLVLRTHWPTSNARYWIQIVPLAAVLLSAGFETFSWGRRIWTLLGVAIGMWYAQRELFWGVSGVTLTNLPWVAALLWAGFWGVRALLLRNWRTELAVVGVTAVPLLVAAVTEYRDAHRWAVYADQGTMSYHHLLRYWVRAAERLDEPERPHRIAVTSAPWQNGDNWLVYPFLGRRFQNELMYVPISESGEIVPFDGSTRYLETSYPAAWVARLYQRGVTHVMSFWPPSIEVYWMLQYPQVFEPISVSRKWGGCFRLKSWADAQREFERSMSNSAKAEAP
jgi:hypothetical protein